MKNPTMQGEVFSKAFDRRGRGFSLRMAPMIDMIFLLLIFFLVAANWRPEESFLPFRLPTARAQGQRIVKPEPLLIHIRATQTGCQVQIGQRCTVQIEDQAIEADLVVLMEEISRTLSVQKRYAGDPIEIVCGPQVKWEHLAKMYNVFFGAGLSDITFAMTE